MRGGVDVGQDPFRLAAEKFAGSGQRHLPGGAVEQGDVQLAFQLPDRIRQRRLGDVELLGGLTEVAGVSHRREVPQVT
jgi:hypothetical protein